MQTSFGEWLQAFRTHESRIVYVTSHAPQPELFEHSTVTIEEVIEDTVTIEKVIKDDAWRNYIDGDGGKPALTGPGSLTNYMIMKMKKVFHDS